MKADALQGEAVRVTNQEDAAGPVLLPQAAGRQKPGSILLAQNDGGPNARRKILPEHIQRGRWEKLDAQTTTFAVSLDQTAQLFSFCRGYAANRNPHRLTPFPYRGFLPGFHLCWFII